MAYTLTQEQADEVVRILGFDGLVEDSEFVAHTMTPFYHYFLEDGTIIEIGPDCQIQHQRLVEDPADGLVPFNMQDVDALGVDWGVVELRRDGVTKGWLDLCAAPELLTPEQRHIHDLRILDITERTM